MKKKGTTALYLHQSLEGDAPVLPAAMTAVAPSEPYPLEMNDSSSQFTRDSSTLEHKAGITKLYPHQSCTHQSLGGNTIVPTVMTAVAPSGLCALEMNDSSSQFTRDSSTLEHRAGITKLYPHQSLGMTEIHLSSLGGNLKVPSQKEMGGAKSNVVEGVVGSITDAESTQSSLPHVHYPTLQDEQHTQSNNEFWNSSLSHIVRNNPKESTNSSNTAHKVSSDSSRPNGYSTTHSTTSSFEGIPNAIPLRSTCESSSQCTSNEEDGARTNNMGVIDETKVMHSGHGYNRQISGSSFVSANSLGANSIKGGNSLASNSLSLGSHNSQISTAQTVLDLSTNSLADALIGHDEEERSYYYEEDTLDENPLSPGGYSADQSSFTLAARPIDDCSQSSSTQHDSLNLMELKQALPMEGSEDDDSRIHHYGFGHARDVEMRRDRVHRPHVDKPFIPQTFPSLLDSSMSSSYSVSAPPSTTPSFDNCADVQREGSKEEREDTLPSQIGSVPRVGYIEEPLAIEVPLPMPLPPDGSRYIVDLEQIVEESSGPEVGDLSSSSHSGGAADKAAMSFVHSKNVENEGTNDQHITRRDEAAQGNLSTVKEEDQQPSATTTRPNQNIHRDSNDQFFNYRHQYYTEQYHYFDGDKYPSKGGDDDTDSTCSSVTLSQAFQRSVDEESYASSSFTESSPHSTLSTVSSVTLSHALSVDRHEHSDQGFYVAVRLGDYIEGQNEEEIEVESVRGGEAISRVDVEERDVDEVVDQKHKAEDDSGHSIENTSNDPTEVTSPSAVEDVLSDAPAVATKEITQSNERVESDILNMLIPECGVPIPSVMSKMGKQRSKGGMLLPWHSTRSIQNYQYGGGRRKKRNTMSSNSSLFSISSVHTFRG